MNPKEAIEVLKKQIRVRQRLDGLSFESNLVFADDGSGKQVVMLTSEIIKDEDTIPAIEEVYNFVIRDGGWMRVLLHHIEHLEGENRDLWDELQKGKGDG